MDKLEEVAADRPRADSSLGTKHSSLPDIHHGLSSQQTWNTTGINKIEEEGQDASLAESLLEPSSSDPLEVKKPNFQIVCINPL